ncbi:uncharacterized protein LOC128236616 [Mya arenaria]|uniref:uncharacterized protein LOC128236616 n=1 Tax=Mya arenaria TaxID=6604 RepID=UPI0022DEBE7A|nr:uncharacterized protein LOC128236616 [Mya arenaria]
MATNELNDNDYNGVKRGSHSTQEGKSGAQSLIKDKIPEDSGMRVDSLSPDGPVSLGDDISVVIYERSSTLQDSGLPNIEPNTFDEPCASSTYMDNKTLASAKEALMEFGYDFTDDEVNEAYNQLKRTNDIKKYKGVADKLIPIMEAKREEKLPEIIASGQRKINARS